MFTKTLKLAIAGITLCCAICLTISQADAQVYGGGGRGNHGSSGSGQCQGLYMGIDSSACSQCGLHQSCEAHNGSIRLECPLHGHGSCGCYIVMECYTVSFYDPPTPTPTDDSNTICIPLASTGNSTICRFFNPLTGVYGGTCNCPQI